jgi:predicted alternative tryptophan synthase beta-subunit
LPAPESAHAVKGAIDEALRCKESGESKTILIGLSGHGNFDMSAYDAYLAGELEDIELPEANIQAAMAALPRV